MPSLQSSLLYNLLKVCSHKFSLSWNHFLTKKVETVSIVQTAILIIFSQPHNNPARVEATPSHRHDSYNKRDAKHHDERRGHHDK
jgi:hypothetical protein